MRCVVSSPNSKVAYFWSCFIGSYLLPCNEMIILYLSYFNISALTNRLLNLMLKYLYLLSIFQCMQIIMTNGLCGISIPLLQGILYISLYANHN